jgi:hypothetical protein
VKKISSLTVDQNVRYSFSADKKSTSNGIKLGPVLCQGAGIGAKTARNIVFVAKYKKIPLKNH